MFDLIFRGGTVFPGEGSELEADVGVRDDLIVAVEPGLDPTWATQVVDATGLFLCPGFIDMHSHSALEPFRDPRLSPKIAQGFTTEVINPDGLAPAPVSAERKDERRAYLLGLEGVGPDEWEWSTFAEYLDALAAARPATTLVPSIGHNAVRDLVIGSDQRHPDERELATMRREIRLGLEQGARSVSLGLVYLPGIFAGTEELVAIGEEAARVGAPLVPHVRNEAADVLEAHAEMIDVARRSGAPLHLSHLKVVGNAELLEPMLEQIDSARREIDLTFDQYPYGAGSTILSSLLPPWALVGGPTRILERLADEECRKKMSRHVASGLPGWENIYKTCGPDAIFIAHAAPPRDSDVGKSLTEIALDRESHPFTIAMDLLLDTRLNATRIDHYATEDTVKAIFRHPGMLVGSDGIFSDRPHPRLYGTAARVLGRYAIREGLIDVVEAVARLTSRPADRLGLADRGRISVGRRADIVLLDPEQFLDTATYEQPISYPEGVLTVFVAGKSVWQDGQPTGLLPGGVVRDPLAKL